MSDDQFWYLVSRLFVVEQNLHLEKKAWFRFIKVVQGLAILFVILVTAVVAYLLFDAKSVSTATLKCNDGTTWNAMDPKYETIELDTNQKCGLCNNRTGNKYQNCNYDDSYEMRNESYTVERIYKKNHSLYGSVGWSLLVLFGGLVFVKLIAKAVVYVLGGNKEE